MRITHEMLEKVIRDTVTRRTRGDRNLLAIYLCGAMLEPDYLLGGTGDIDLVMIHIDDITQPREIEPLSEDIHLDVAHHFHREYRQMRQLRSHPWLGPVLNSCRILYDPQHFLDFTQASIRGYYKSNDQTLVRALGQVEHARQIWLSFHTQPVNPGPDEIATYFRAVDHATNAVACLTGLPLTERRFLLKFPERAGAVNRSYLYPQLLELLGGQHADADRMQTWLIPWQHAMQSITPDQVTPRLHPTRIRYYRNGIEAILKGDRPLAALWPLLHTWTLAVKALPASAAARQDWQDALTQLGLLEGAFQDRIRIFDSYLDQVEETLDVWGRTSGAEDPMSE
jgi:hypothetical protein